MKRAPFKHSTTFKASDNKIQHILKCKLKSSHKNSQERSQQAFNQLFLTLENVCTYENIMTVTLLTYIHFNIKKKTGLQ